MTMPCQSSTRVLTDGAHNPSRTGAAGPRLLDVLTADRAGVPRFSARVHMADCDPGGGDPPTLPAHRAARWLSQPLAAPEGGAGRGGGPGLRHGGERDEPSPFPSDATSREDDEPWDGTLSVCSK